MFLVQCYLDRLTRYYVAVKRIMQEARELSNDPCTDYHAAPLEVRAFHTHSPYLADTLCKYRTTYLYVTSPSSMFHVERHDAGMALHTSWSRWHGIRGWSISLPDSASRRIPLPTAFSNDAYPKRTVRVEYQGKSPAIAYEIGH